MPLPSEHVVSLRQADNPTLECGASPLETFSPSGRQDARLLPHSHHTLAGLVTVQWGGSMCVWQSDTQLSSIWQGYPEGGHAGTVGPGRDQL